MAANQPQRVQNNDPARWGHTLGNQVLVWRSGLGVTADGALVYVAGPGLSAYTLAQLPVRAGAVRAMELGQQPRLHRPVCSVSGQLTARTPSLPCAGRSGLLGWLRTGFLPHVIPLGSPPDRRTWHRRLP